MLINIPSDIEKKVDHVIICLPFSKLNLKNLLQNQIPSESELLTLGRGLKIRLEPGDSDLDHRWRIQKAGGFWDLSFNAKVLENNKPNFDQINRFTNQRVVLLIGTSTYRYQLGWEKQLLEFTFREKTDSLDLSFSGSVYYPAARQQITSFRTTF